MDYDPKTHRLTDEALFRQRREGAAKRTRRLFRNVTEHPLDPARRAAADPTPARKSSAGLYSAIIVDAYDERKKIDTMAERLAKLPEKVRQLGRTRGIGIDVLEVFNQLLLMYRGHGDQPLNIDSSDLPSIMGTTDASKMLPLLGALLN